MMLALCAGRRADEDAGGVEKQQIITAKYAPQRQISLLPFAGRGDKVNKQGEGLPRLM